MKWITGATIAVAVLAAGCTSGDVDATELVCDEFAAHAKAGLPRDGRGDTTRSISEIIDNADEPVRDAFGTLRRAVDSPDPVYRQAADVFAESCFDVGWDG